MNSSVGRELMKLLKTPVDAYNSVIKLLALAEYSSVLAALDYRGRTQICAYLINNMLDNDTLVQEEEHVEKVRSGQKDARGCSFGTSSSLHRLCASGCCRIVAGN